MDPDVSVRVHWFRHGLRLHDNPSLLEIVNGNIQNKKNKIFPIFIFDGESAGTKHVGYNRMKFLLESLTNLEEQFRELGGQLYIFRGNPVEIFHHLWKVLSIDIISFEYDCEPIWNERDESVKKLCQNLGIKCIEKVSHTLWDPRIVIETNGGIPPLTYQMFLHTVQIIGYPPKPVENPNWGNVEFVHLSQSLKQKLGILENIPTPEDFNIYKKNYKFTAQLKWKGGESEALKNFNLRLKVEEDAFKNGFYLPNQLCSDILGTSTSMSPYLRFGCLSVRKFYWAIHDLLHNVSSFNYTTPAGPHITGQLIWREYFYTMSVNNINYGQMKGNEICLEIPWASPSQMILKKWQNGETGIPLIDAAMRQLLVEGWIHHTLRNVVASFLTRGYLWYSWELGLQHFLKYLLDADWSVCAGNWMWVSSSAFEELLDSSKCTCPIALSRRLDPNGEYIKRYVPELSNLPKQYIHEPWKCPKDIQKEVGCTIGINYPEPIIDLVEASKRNCLTMKRLRSVLLLKDLNDGVIPPHCRPSNEEEIRQFFWLEEK